MQHMTILNVTVYPETDGLRRADVKVGHHTISKYVSVEAKKDAFEDTMLMKCAETAHHHGCLFGIPKERDELYERLNKIAGFNRFELVRHADRQDEPNAAWQSDSIVELKSFNMVDGVLMAESPD